MTEDVKIEPVKTDPEPVKTVKEEVKLTPDPNNDIIRQMQEKLDKLEKEKAIDKEKADTKEKAFHIAQIAKAGFKTDGYEKYSLDALEKIALNLKQKDDTIIITRKEEPKAKPVITIWNPKTSKHEPFYKHQQPKK